MGNCTQTYHILGSYAHLGSGCGCEDDNCNACPVQSANIIYSGPNLSCTGIRTCDALDVALQKIDDKICALAQLISDLS